MTVTELAYPVGHPKHPDFTGVAQETHGTTGYDYEDSHPARGGQGQRVPLVPGTEGTPRDGFRHLLGLDLSTLANAQAEFSKLSTAEQERRIEWNKTGIPAKELEGEK